MTEDLSHSAFTASETRRGLRIPSKTFQAQNKVHEVQLIEHADPQDYSMVDAFDHDVGEDDYDYEDDSASSLELAYHASMLAEDASSLAEAIDAAKDQLDIPGLVESEPSKQDALTVLYLSEASRKLGKTNSAYFYEQQALTIVEIIELKARKLHRSRYGTATTGTLIPASELKMTLDAWKKEAEVERQQQRQTSP